MIQNSTFVVFSKSGEGFEAVYPFDMFESACRFFAQIYSYDKSVQFSQRFENGDMNLTHVVSQAFEKAIAGTN